MARPRSIQIDAISQKEILNNSPYYRYGGGSFFDYPPDKVLKSVQSERLYGPYIELLNEAHTFAVNDKLWQNITQRDYYVEPASDNEFDIECARALEQDLKALGQDRFVRGPNAVVKSFGGFDEAFYKLCQASHYGHRAAEVVWGQNEDRVVLKDIKPLPMGLVRPTPGEKGWRLVLSPEFGGMYRKDLPYRKIIWVAFDAELDNPWGNGTAAKTYSPAFFKRTMAQFALQFADANGDPKVIMKYAEEFQISLDEDTTNGKQRASDVLLKQGIQLKKSGVAVVPDTVTVDFVEIGQAPIYTGLMDYFDGQTSRAVLGETGTTDQSGSGGSRAQDEIADLQQLRIAKGLSDLVCEAINSSAILWWWQLNRAAFPRTTKPPRVKRRFAELEEREDLGILSDVAATITDASGYRIEKAWYEDKFQVPMSEALPEQGAIAGGQTAETPRLETDPNGPLTDGAPTSFAEYQGKTLSAIAEMSGIDRSVLCRVRDRGYMETQDKRLAKARVIAFVAGGKSRYEKDFDLWELVDAD